MDGSNFSIGRAIDKQVVTYSKAQIHITGLVPTVEPKTISHSSVADFFYEYVIIATNQAVGPCSHHLQRKFRSCQTCYQVNFFLPLVTLHSRTHFLRIGYNSRADYMNRLHCLFGTLLPSSILANTKSVLISIYAEKAEP